MNARLSNYTNDLIESVRYLLAEQSTYSVKLAATLYELLDLDPLTLGYATRAEFFDYLGIAERKAYHLRQVHRVFRDSGIKASAVEALGWTKASAIASLWPRGSVPDLGLVRSLFDHAARTDGKGAPVVTLGQLQNTVRAARARLKNRSPALPTEKKSWTFREDEKVVVDHALKLAQAKFSEPGRETISEGKALSRILLEWELQAKQGLTIDDVIHMVEAMHGVRLQVVPN